MYSFRRLALLFSVLTVSLLLFQGGLVSTMVLGQKKGPVRITLTDQQKSGKQEKGKNPFDGKFAMKSLEKICAIGTRISGTKGMLKQQEILIKHFEKLGAKVKKQSFQARHPITRKMVTLTNLIVQFYPDKKKRILFCTHYDTRPRPDRDPTNPNGVFLGANDGASGCGLLMELGKHIKNRSGLYGIDFVFFDGEEFVYQRPRDPLFRGSTFFAETYAKQRAKARTNPKQKSDEPIYVCGILLDMIGDKHLDLYWEKNSYHYAKDLTTSIWFTAFIADPAPASSPSSNSFSAIASKAGRALANAALLPEAKMDNVPSPARIVPPDTGASK